MVKLFFAYMFGVMTICVILEFTIDLPGQGSEFWIYAGLLSSFITLMAIQAEIRRPFMDRYNLREMKNNMRSRGIRKF